MIYEFITPSDPITFVANSDALAFALALYMGRGKAGCKKEDGTNLNTMLAFASEEVAKKAIQDNLGMEFQTFMDKHRREVAEAFGSFAYGSMEARKQYDDAIAAITDPEKLATFKATHEDRQRTSMSRWVKSAWDIADSLRKEVE